jgi:ATP-dependent Clp protease ATP-binding subunit ClpX
MTSAVQHKIEDCCSFCGREKSSVDRLVAGPAVYICDGCIRKAEQILLDDTARTLNDPGSQSDDQLLETMLRLHRSREDVEQAVASYVSELRKRGMAWSRIGESLGISRQSAWERYSRED